MPRISVKEDIVVAALQTLHRKGFNGCSVQDITETAGVPKGSFYNHFQSKEDLAVEVLDRYWLQIQNSLDILADTATSPAQRLQRYFRHLNDIARKNEYATGCFVGNMSSEMSSQSGAIREKLAAVTSAWSRAIETCVRDAQADGSFKNTVSSSSTAAFLLNSWEGAVMRAKVDRSHASLDDFETVAFSGLKT